jgi:hypothetical protein
MKRTYVEPGVRALASSTSNWRMRNVDAGVDPLRTLTTLTVVTVVETPDLYCDGHHDA